MVRSGLHGREDTTIPSLSPLLVLRTLRFTSVSSVLFILYPQTPLFLVPSRVVTPENLYLVPKIGYKLPRVRFKEISLFPLLLEPPVIGESDIIMRPFYVPFYNRCK